MIKCLKCGDVNDKPTSRRVCDGPSEAFGVRRTTYRDIETCPHCSSASIETVIECQSCFKQPAMNGDDYCAPCALLIDLDQERDYELDLDAVEAESRHNPVRDLHDAMRDIANGNLRRAS